MRFDFKRLHFPAVYFILNPDELHIELVTGEKLPVCEVLVDLWHSSVEFISEANIKDQSVVITDESKKDLIKHATHTVRERLGIPESGPYGRVLSERWVNDGPPKVWQESNGKGCYLSLGFYPTE